MGRPIHKRFFGTSTTESDFRIRFKTNGTEYDGFIVAQKGDKKFKVSNGPGNVTATCLLVGKNDASLANGEMTIKGKLDNGTAGFVSKISGRKCTLVNAAGVVIATGPWGFGSSLTDGYIQLEEQAGMSATAIRGNATIVTGNVDLGSVS